MTFTLHDRQARGFASDNYAGVHPEVLQALADANGGHQSSYGADVYTARLAELLREQFGDGVEGFGVFNGTGANVVGLQSLLPRWGSVIAPQSAHINTDEAGAPERVAAIKLLTVPTVDGKLRPDDLGHFPLDPSDVHHPLPAAVSITQSTEYGTVYTVDEVRALSNRAHRLGLPVHMDGARIANAAVSLGVGLREITREAGVDVLSFGGTKNGLMFGELVVVLTPGVAAGLEYLRKLNMQLDSKMRFLSAQFVALLTDDLWLRSASRANAMAARLRTGIEKRLADGVISGIEFTQEPQANTLLARLPAGVADRLREHFSFYDWDPVANEVRWVCSFDTTEDDVDSFLAVIEEELSVPAG